MEITRSCFYKEFDLHRDANIRFEMELTWIESDFDSIPGLEYIASKMTNIQIRNFASRGMWDQYAYLAENTGVASMPIAIERSYTGNLTIDRIPQEWLHKGFKYRSEDKILLNDEEIIVNPRFVSYMLQDLNCSYGMRATGEKLISYLSRCIADKKEQEQRKIVACDQPEKEDDTNCIIVNGIRFV